MVLLPGMVVVLGSVEAVGAVDFVTSGSGSTVVVLELVGTVEFVVFVPLLRQPAKSIAVRTRISIKILAFFI